LRRLPLLHELQPSWTVVDLGERLGGHRPGAGFGPRHVGSDLKPVALHGDAEVAGGGVARHDGEGVSQGITGERRQGREGGGEEEHGDAHQRASWRENATSRLRFAENRARGNAAGVYYWRLLNTTHATHGPSWGPRAAASRTGCLRADRPGCRLRRRPEAPRQQELRRCRGGASELREGDCR